MKNRGYLIEFVDKEAGNHYYECGWSEYKEIMREFKHNEAIDRTACDLSWQEHAEKMHNYNLSGSI